MLKQEKSLLSKLFFAEEEEWELQQKILNIPSKFWNQEANAILKRYKQIKLDGKPGLDILYEEEFQKQINDIISTDHCFFRDRVDAYIKSLKERYYKNYLLDLVLNRKEYNPIEEIMKLNQELLEQGDDGVEESSLTELEKLFYTGLENTSRIKTGDSYFDNKLRFNRKNLNIIAARPGVGKSSFGLHLALGMSQFGKGMFFSLEMSNQELAQRVIAMTSGVYLEYLCDKSKWEGLSQNGKQKAKKCFEELKERPLKFLDGNYSIERIKERIRREKEANGLDFVFVDYLQLVNSAGKTEYERVTEVSKSLKRIAKEFDITIVAMAQLNREADGEKKKRETQEDIFLSNLKSSGQIEQDGAVILGLMTKETEEVGTDMLYIKILKNRFGDKRHIFQYKYHKPNQVFYRIGNYER